MNKREVYDFLTARGVPFEATEHKAVFNMAEAAQLEVPHPEGDAKCLFVRDDKRQSYCLIVVKGDKRVNLNAFRRQNGLRPLCFASEDELASMLSLKPGAVTPLGVLNEREPRVKVFIDQALLNGMIGVHPNDNTATVWLKTSDLIDILRAHGNEVAIAAL